MAKEQLKREDVPESLTWNIEDIFKSDQEFEDAIKRVEGYIAQIEPYSDKVTDSASNLLKVTDLAALAGEELGKVYGYAARTNDSDTANARGNQLLNSALLIYNRFSAAMAFYDPSVTSLGKEKLTEFLEDEPELQKYRFNLERIQSQSAHTLKSNEEKLLAQLEPAIDDAADISTKLDDTDLNFGMIKNEDGEDVQLTNATASIFATSSDPDMRMRAAKQLDTAYYSVRNTFAATLRSHVHAQNIVSEIRHFDSARQMNLSENNIPESVYDTLVSVTHEHLDLLHDYYSFRKKVLGLDKMYQHDRHVPLVSDAKLDFTFDEGKKIASEALAPLGKDYLGYLSEEFSNRWIDAAENKGKRSGGYEDDVYGIHPYILLNWSDVYDSTSTLVHESGHALQSVYTDKAQPYWYSHYPIFTAEIASTLNEGLLNNYMLKKYEKQPKIQAFILTQDIDNFIGTIYRQTLFAEFEHFIYTEDAKGTTLTPDLMAEKFNGLFEEYNGSAVEKTPWPDDTWARIPHFYYNYYVYQYATSKAIATSLGADILEQKPGSVERYKEFLSAGASDYPVDIIKKAGIDVTNREYLDKAFRVFEKEVKQLKQSMEQPG